MINTNTNSEDKRKEAILAYYNILSSIQFVRLRKTMKKNG
jgi:hypothetical protein